MLGDSGSRTFVGLARRARWLAALAAFASVCAFAGDPTSGMAIYNNIPDAAISCGNSSCHGPNPNDNINGLQAGGNNAGVIKAAIRGKVTQMMFLTGLLNPFQLDDVSAYLAPQPALSNDGIDFGTQSSGTVSAPLSVTLRNPGGVNLVVDSIAIGGPDAADFTVGGSCIAGASLQSTTIGQPGGECDVSVTFHPVATGPHSATITLGYAGATTFPETQAILLTGSADLAPVPEAAASTGSLDFGALFPGDVSPPQTLVVSNPGTGPLLILGLSVSGEQASEFSVAGTCASAATTVAVAPGSTCELQVQFAPHGINDRNALLRIDHNAAGSPLRVALAGFGNAPTCQPPAPAAESRILSCPAGQQGSLLQSRSYACDGSTWMPSPWLTVSNSCRNDFPAADLDLVELFNSTLLHYFITADASERQGIAAGAAGPGWSETGVRTGKVWSEGAALLSDSLVPVCRFYGNRSPGPDGHPPGPNSHFYTADADECAAVKQDIGWVFEGIVFHVVAANAGACAAPLMPVHRFYNGRFAENDSNHRYVADPAIVAQMAAAGWTPEGIVFCIATQ